MTTNNATSLKEVIDELLRFATKDKAEIAALKADVKELVESLEKIHKIAERLFLYEPRLNAGVPDIRATASNILAKHRDKT